MPQTHLSIWLIWPQIWWPHERLLVEFKRQGQARERGEGWTQGGRQGWRNGVEGWKKGKWIPDGLFLVLTEGLARATRPYCSSDAPSTTRTLWRGSSVAQQAVTNACDGLRRSTRLLLVINDAFTLLFFFFFFCSPEGLIVCEKMHTLFVRSVWE